MAFISAKLKRDLRLQKEGIIVGALLGLGVTAFLFSKGIDFSVYAATQGVFDNFVSDWNLEKIGLWKVGITFMVLGSFLGYWVDKIVKPGK